MMKTSHRLPGLVLSLAMLSVGWGLGLLAVRNWTPTTNAIILSIVSGVLLLSNVVTKSLNDVFTEHLKIAKTLDARRFASLVSYVSARRFEVNIGWLLSNSGGVLGALAAASRFIPATSAAIPAAVQSLLFVIAYSVSFAASPYFLRAANYWRLGDRFSYQLETYAAEQTLRKERLASMSIPGELVKH